MTREADFEVEGLESAQEPVGWRAVFGKARPEDTAEVDQVIAEEFGVSAQSPRDSACAAKNGSTSDASASSPSTS